MLSLFQSCVVNYHDALVDWFGISLSEIVPVGMMAIVYDRSPDDFDLTSKTLKTQLGAEAVAYLAKLQADIQEERQALGFPKEFSAEFKYTLSSTHNRNKADVIVASGADGIPFGFVAVPRDAATTHPYKTRKCVEKIVELLEKRHAFNGYDMTCICAVHGTSLRPEHYFKGALDQSPQYSQMFVDWVISEYEKDNDLFAKARKAYKELKDGDTKAAA